MTQWSVRAGWGGGGNRWERQAMVMCCGVLVCESRPQSTVWEFFWQKDAATGKNHHTDASTLTDWLSIQLLLLHSSASSLFLTSQRLCQDRLRRKTSLHSDSPAAFSWNISLVCSLLNITWYQHITSGKEGVVGHKHPSLCCTRCSSTLKS